MARTTGTSEYTATGTVCVCAFGVLARTAAKTTQRFLIPCHAQVFAEPDLHVTAVVALEAIELVYRRLASISISEADIPALRSADSKLARLVVHPLVTRSVASAEGAALEAIASLGTPQDDEWL